MSTPTVLICEDAPGFQLLLQSVFGDAGFTVTGVAEDWAEAERLTADTQPDVVLLDLWLPTFDVEAVARLRAAVPAALLVVVSGLAVEEANEVLEGVSGIDLVLTKREVPSAIVSAVQERLSAR